MDAATPQHFAIWLLIVGALLFLMALAGTLLKRLPLSMAMLYLGVGCALGAFGLARLDPRGDAILLERLAETAVLISLFSAGLKLNVSLRDARWHLPIRLATLAMLFTVAGIAVAAHFGAGLPWGAAVLLGAILAPTDPVLASDVQVAHPDDGDALRFGLTAEGGLNDGTAFPLVMLGLGLLGVHELGSWGWRWWAVDVVWAVSAGLVLGALLGAWTGRLVTYLRTHHREAVGLDEFLALGLIAVAYGLAVLCHAYGFLAVFAAGLALRRFDHPDDAPEALVVPALPDPREALATNPESAASYLKHAMLSFTEQLERVAEVVIVLLLGILLLRYEPPSTAWLIPLLLLLIRPLATWLSLLGRPASAERPPNRWLVGWFGVRGIGSIYYLFYAINHGLPRELVTPFIEITLFAVASSIVLHGLSITPLMNRRARRLHA
ncbi:cation:proton antiporter [Chitinolyticbacter albus]|uniref:cation:proton antiporter n=1 Tax=Chitinolyticbacter albus TaxID=2961951 RepID=UPI00210E87E9|nr:cation:proton antiporter [Chitinolyticbacter albus]